MTTETELHTLEWSKRQNSLHIDTARRVIGKNVARLVANEDSNDYILVGFGTRAEIDAMAEHYHWLIDERDKTR